MPLGFLEEDMVGVEVRKVASNGSYLGDFGQQVTVGTFVAGSNYVSPASLSVTRRILLIC